MPGLQPEVIASAVSPEASSGRKPLIHFRRETVLLVIMALSVAGASCVFPRSFPTWANLSALLRNSALDGVMGCGMVLLMVAGFFDLSVGSMFSMCGVLTAWLLTQTHIAVAPAVGLGLGLGAIGGLVNGWLVAHLRVNALIATLGTMQVFRGVAVLVGGPGISGLPDGLCKTGQAEWLGLQTPVWLMLAIGIVSQLLLSKTRFFRQYYYIGSNAKAAMLSGISVQRLEVLGFGIMGFLAGLAGIVFATRVGTATSTAGDGAELRIITAVILGGASLSGGRGTVWGTLCGIFFISLVTNIMIFARLSPEWQSIIIGCVLAIAVAMDRFLGGTK